MKKIFLIICLLISLSACNGGGGKIPTDKLGIPTICGCGAAPSYVTDSQKGESMTMEEFKERSKSW